MQDLSVRMSASGSCRTTCARSLHQELLCKISLSGSLHQHFARWTRDLRGGLHFEIRKRNFTSISRDGLARSPQGFAVRNQKRNLPAFRAIDARNLFGNQKTQLYQKFRTLDTHGHPRSPQRVHLSKPCFRSTALATKSLAEVIRNAALAT